MSDIKKLFLFDGLNEESVNQILLLLPEKTHYKRGMTIYSAEHFSNAIGYIIGGKASAFTDNSNHFVMKKFVAGMSFGVAAVFGKGEKYISTIVADSDCVVQLIPESILRQIFSLYPETVENYIIFLSDKIRYLNKKLSVISCCNTEDSVYLYLLNAADNDGIVQLPTNMTLLSKMLGMGRASLYRNLCRLESNKMIVRENNIIRVIRNEKNY